MPPFPRKAEVAAEWLASRLAEFSRTSCGDVFGLATGQQRPAAVLAALLWHAEVPAVLLTRRTEGLRDHAGPAARIGLGHGVAAVLRIAGALQSVKEDKKRLRGVSCVSPVEVNKVAIVELQPLAAICNAGAGQVLRVDALQMAGG